MLRKENARVFDRFEPYVGLEYDTNKEVREVETKEAYTELRCCFFALGVGVGVVFGVRV